MINKAGRCKLHQLKERISMDAEVINVLAIVSPTFYKMFHACNFSCSTKLNAGTC